MVHLYVRPSETVVRSLLQIERVKFICLGCGAGHQPVKHRRIVFNTRTENG